MKYDAVIFDLLTALIDSWTLWNDVAGSPDAGMTWRRRYLEITYGCGPYRPYEILVREAARDVGLPESLGSDLERRWGELTPWPETHGVLARIPLPLAVATNCSVRLGREAADLIHRDTRELLSPQSHALLLEQMQNAVGSFLVELAG